MSSLSITTSRMGKTVRFDFPCREKELQEKLVSLFGFPSNRSVAEVEQVVYPMELSVLNGQLLDLDALNYLARRMDGFDVGEANAFYEGIKAEGFTDLKDLTNLTCNLSRYSLISDVSSFASIGRAHILNTKGSAPTKENETPEQTAEYEQIGRMLVTSGTGCFTEHGLLFVDRESEFVRVYDGGAFPPYYDCTDCEMTATLSYNGQEELLFLPDEESAIMKAVRRLGAESVSDCEVTLETVSAGLVGQLYKSLNRTEGLLAANKVMNKVGGLPYDDKDFLLLLVRNLGIQSSENISLLTDHIDDLFLIPEDTPEEVAEHVLREGDEYHADEEIWDFIDMEGFGDYYISQCGGKFIEGGLLCSTHGKPVEEILDQLEAEPGLQIYQ